MRQKKLYVKTQKQVQLHLFVGPHLWGDTTAEYVLEPPIFVILESEECQQIPMSLGLEGTEREAVGICLCDMTGGMPCPCQK